MLDRVTYRVDHYSESLCVSFLLAGGPKLGKCNARLIRDRAGGQAEEELRYCVIRYCVIRSADARWQRPKRGVSRTGDIHTAATKPRRR